MEKRTVSKQSRVKLIVGLVIPVLVLAIAIIAVSFSYAWFSTSVNGSVDSINLATATAFVLTFDSAGERGDNLNYKGQQAMVSGESSSHTNKGRLIKFSGESELLAADAPFYFVSPLNISTEGKELQVQFDLEYAKIAKGEHISDLFGTSTEVADATHLSSDIPYAFTWFVKKATIAEGNVVESATNYMLDANGKNVMKPLAPAEGETWYTPYGTAVFGEGGKIATLNGTPTTQIPEGNGSATNTLSADKNGEAFHFYIVFAPERLFWAQFFSGNTSSNFGSIYKSDTDAKQKVCGTKFAEADLYKMFYSDLGYQGSTFSFAASLNVIGEIKGEVDG